VAKNTAVLAVARIIERGTTLVLTLIIASKLGAAGLGTFATALAIFGVISVAGEAGATLFLIRELASDRSRTGSYIVHLSILGLGASLVVTAAAEVVVRHVGYSAGVVDSVSLILLAIAPRTLNTIQEGAFVVYGRTEFETITTFVSSAIFLGVSLLLLSNGYGITSVVAAFVVLEYVVTIVYYVLIARSIARLEWKFQWPLARRLIKEVKAFTGSSALAALFSRPEIIILSLIAGATQVGYYGAAVRIAEVGLFVPEVFLNNVYPMLARARIAGSQRFGAVQAKAIRYSMAFALPLTAWIVVEARPIIETLFGPGFGPSVVLLQLLAVNLTVYTLLEVFWRSVSAQGRQDVVLRVMVVIVATRLSLGVAFIYPWLALGAAISALLSSSLHALLLGRSVRGSGVPPRVVSVVWPFAVAATIMGGASWLAAQWLSIWVVTPLAAAIYFAVLAALHAFPAEDLRALRTMRPIAT
jgi:O-antigen/teichoic acid export membrane protein